MSWLDLRKFRLAIASTLAVLFVIYFILLCGEFALAYQTRPTGQTLEAIHAIKLRIEQQDIPQRKAALRDGYKPVISPGNISSSWKLRALALKHNIAPLAPQPNSKLYLCNEGYGLVRYTSDRFGFRNPDDVWEKDIDVILIGDSFVHGACVRDDETISAHLRNKFNVLNLGTEGNNGITYAALVKRFVPRLRPKVVALIFFANDFTKGDRTSFYYLMHFANSSDYFDSASNELRMSKEMTTFYQEAEKVVVAQVTKDLEGGELLERFTPGHRYWSEDRFELDILKTQISELSQKLFSDSGMPFGVKLAIDTAVEFCGQTNCTPVIAFIPARARWGRESASKHYSSLLSEYAGRKGLQFVDGTQALRSLGDSAFARVGGHLSPEGYEAFAEALAEGLDK